VVDDLGRDAYVERGTEHVPAGPPVDVAPSRIEPRGKLPGALLLVAEGGGAHWRDWVSEQTRRLCKLTGVPVVCAHSLRGVASTAAVEAGVAVEAVASLLGHESSRMTRQSYIRPGTVEQAEREQTQRVLAGSTVSQSLGQG